LELESEIFARGGHLHGDNMTPTISQSAGAGQADNPKEVTHARKSRSQRFLSGVILTYGYQGLLVIAGIWLTPFFLAHIGQHEYGLWLVGTQLLTYLTLTDFGVVALLPLETAYATGRAGGAQETDELPQLVGQTARIVLYQLPVVMAVAVAMWSTLPAAWHDLRGPLAVVLLGFVVAFPLRILPALLQGLQDLAFVNGFQIVVWVASTAATLLMVLAGWNLYALATGWLISQILMTPFYVYRLWRRFPGVLPRRLPAVSWAKSRAQLGKGFWINVAQIAHLLMSNTDLLIIGRLLGPAAVVPYACTGKLPGVLANQAMILMHQATPALCELKAGESRQKILQVLVALNLGILTFSGLVFCVVLVINHWFVDWWVTARQYGGFALTVAILLSMLIRHWTTTTGYCVFCFGHQRRISLTNLADGLVTAGACLGLTMWLGPVGAPVGSLLGACLVSLPLNLRQIAWDTGVSVPHLVTAMLGSWSWRFAAVAAGAVLVAMRWSPKTLPEAAAAGASVAIIYVLVMLPNVLRSPLGSYLWPLLASIRCKYSAFQMRFSS
jgi:O-antigen/teichoic acid export membrane protein